jgi:hypothetical protein
MRSRDLIDRRRNLDGGRFIDRRRNIDGGRHHGPSTIFRRRPTSSTVDDFSTTADSMLSADFNLL